MATAGEIVVRITADISEFERQMNHLRLVMDEHRYVLATMTAEFTRLDRALWATRPLAERIWLTIQRKGW